MTATDEMYMEEALALARRAAGRTSPNPLVGAVVVANGEIVGRGFHHRAGEPHAEILALREARDRARGATVYVTLEPCSHAGRTGPCTEALIAAGVRRVVIPMVDPDPQVNGRGIARLREAGIEVQVGLLEAPARQVNEFFLKHRRTALPFVTVKWAMSLDGKISTHRATETAITGEQARRYVHELRNVYDAVLVGVQTVLADDPQLTCRIPGGRNPLRIVADSRLRTPLTAHVVADAEGRTLIVATAAAPPNQVEALRRASVEVLIQEHARAQVDLRGLMEELAQRGVLSVLIEGGGTMNAAVLEAGLVDKIVAIIAPSLIGGAQAPTPVDGAGLSTAGQSVRLRNMQIRQLGNDVVIEGYVEG